MELEQYLVQNGIWHRFVDKPETIHTADAAAKAGIDLKLVTKSLILLADEKDPVLAIIPGDCKLSFEKLKSVLGVKKVFLVRFSEAEKYSGYPPGGTPMVHHSIKMRVVLDKGLTAHNTIFGGGGSRIRLLELKVSDVVSLNSAVIADIVEP